MKALTLWQPWASLVILGAKPFEFRRWRAPSSMIGQRIVIHAGARPVRRAEVSDLQDRLLVPDRAWTTGLRSKPALDILHDAGSLPLCAGLGTAVIGEPIDGMAAAAEVNAVLFNDSDRHEHANWAWPMLDIQLWDEPMPMRGAQGFWTWPEPESAL